MKVGDESIGCLYDIFSPNETYFRLVQKQIWQFWETNNPDYKNKDALKFNVQLENGYFLFPEGGFIFDDVQDSPNEPIRLDIMGVDSHVLEDFSYDCLLNH
jgi:hypothetical protein